MTRVRFVSADGSRVSEVDAPAGERLLDIAQADGQPLEGTCEGQMACSTCHVIVDAEWAAKLPSPSAAEEDMLDLTYGVTRTSRLRTARHFGMRSKWGWGARSTSACTTLCHSRGQPACFRADDLLTDDSVSPQGKKGTPPNFRKASSERTLGGVPFSPSEHQLHWMVFRGIFILPGEASASSLSAVPYLGSAQAKFSA